MADEQKTILLSLEFDTDEGLKRAANLRSAIDADKEALAELNKTIKKNGEISQDQLVQREKLEQSIKQNTKARTDELRAIENYIKANKNSGDSINNLRGQLGFLAAKWNDLSKAERENKEVGGVMQKEIKRLSDELKELEGSVGDTRRNVGNYTASIENAIAGNSKFSDGIAMAKEGFQGIVDIGGNVIKSFKGISEAQGTVQKSSVALGLSFKAMGIGLIIAAVAGLISYFSKFDAGMDKVERTVKGLTATIETFVKGLAPIGKLITDMFDDPIETLKKLKNGTDEYTVSLGELTTQSIKAGVAIAELTQEFQDLEDAEDRLVLARKRADNQVRLALIATKDRNKTDREKLDLLDKAGAKENEVSKQELDNATKNLRLIRERIAIEAGFTNAKKLSNEQLEELMDSEKVQDAQRKEAWEAEGKRIDAEASRDEALQRIQNRRSAFLEQIAEREQKRREKAAADAEKLRLKQEKAAEEARQKENERLEEIAKQRQIALEQTKLFLDELAALEKKAADEKLERDAFLLRVDIENARIKTATEKEEAEKRKALKEKEHQVLVDFTAAASGLATALANENSELADFQKAVTLFQIGLASAEAYTQGIAKAQSMPFPGNLVAMATTIAAITTNLLNAKKLISEGSAPKYKAQHYDGFGYTGDGDPHQESTALGPKPYTYHKKELIASDAALSNPLGAIAGNILMAIMGKQARFNAPSNFNGGIFTTSISKSMAANAAPVIDYNQLAKAMASMPAPVVGISDIKAKSAEKDKRMRRVTLGV